MKKLGIIFVFINTLLLGLSGCSVAEGLMKLTTESDEVVFNAKDVINAQQVSDLENQIIVQVELSESGQQKLAQFTGNNLNKTLTIHSGDRVLLEGLVIRSRLDMKLINFSFPTRLDADEFLKKIRNRHDS